MILFGDCSLVSPSRIAPIERPHCPKCAEPMLLIRLVPIGALQLQTFECAKCGETQIVEMPDPMKEAGGWRGRDLRRPD